MYCTIYLLTNKNTNKVYVGQTWLPSLSLRMGKNGINYINSTKLYNSIQKHGCDKFEYTILEQHETQSEADIAEDFFIRCYDSLNPEKGYNLKQGGRGGRHTEETKKKISKSLSEKVWSPEAIAARAAAGKQWLGKKRGPQSEEQRLQNSEFMKERHATDGHPMLGKHHTDEAKGKMSIGTKNAWAAGKYPIESIQKRASNRQMPLEKEVAILAAYASDMIISDMENLLETGRSSIYRVLKRNGIARERVNDHWTGKKHTDQTKEKMAVARTTYWAEKKNQDNK